MKQPSEVIHRLLPAQAQDALRSARDLTSASRRRARRKPANRDPLAAAVSPEGVVLGGPFRGMLMHLDGSWGGQAARLCGTYEQELADVVEEAIARRPTQIVDVGAAEGYYSVGLALRLPSVPVLAFDIDPIARRLCRANAMLNATKNVSVRGRATPRVLRRVITTSCTLICDCEGYESTLIDPVSIPTLRSCSLIVELHEFAVAGITETLCRRLSASHRVRLIDAEPRTVPAPALAHLDSDTALSAMQEGRPVEPRMQWLVALPR